MQQEIEQWAVFLPIVFGTVKESEPTPQPAQVIDLGEAESALYELVIADPEQKRTSIALDPLLCTGARERCRDMAERGYVAHVNPDRRGPNFIARQRGAELPDWYDQSEAGNSIESLCAGFATAAAAWTAWRNSPAHRLHVLGECDFFREQVRIGVGYWYDENAPYRHYWVLWSAHVVENGVAASGATEMMSASNGAILTSVDN